MKTVGVVIPIYNVEKYLKECLDSVINQTYTNLEIILVNDGSTDENSLNIAKEYTLKDKRITLFDKKNGGQSTARNVGIEFFSGEYKLKNKIQTIKENSLIEFNIEGNNPYEIYTVYKSYKAFNNEQDLINFTYPIIDYIIFLDSDDYWELNCIEECVPRMDGVDVVWFDFGIFLDGIDGKNVWNYDNHKTDLEYLCYTKDQYITFDDLIYQINNEKVWGFSSITYCMINFRLICDNKIRFIGGIYAEDHHFSIIAFVLSKKIYILYKKYYKYRLRSNSSSNHDGVINRHNFPKFMEYILKEYNFNYISAKKYYIYASWIITCVKILENITYLNDDLKNNIINTFVFQYYNLGLNVFLFNKDPMGVKAKYLCQKNSIINQFNIIDGKNLIYFSPAYRLGSIFSKKNKKYFINPYFLKNILSTLIFSKKFYSSI
ncbi:glycosyltransferase, partial [Campylobacter lari]|nr:glycosyltransferase [Campylobacter lari]